MADESIEDRRARAAAFIKDVRRRCVKMGARPNFVASLSMLGLLEYYEQLRKRHEMELRALMQQRPESARAA